MQFMRYLVLQRIFKIVVALWVGGAITIGFLVTPILFSVLGDRQVAGIVAGNIFQVEAKLSIAISVALIIAVNYLVAKGEIVLRMIRWILLAMLACAIGVGLVLIPWMNSLRDQAMSLGLPVMASSFAELFSRLHSISSLLFILQSLLGISLLWCLAR